MSSARNECIPTAIVAGLLVMTLGWLGCSPPDPTVKHPSVGGSFATAGSGGLAPQTAGSGANAGNAGPAGTGAANGGSGGAPGALPAFDAGSDADRNHVMPGTICARLATIDCAAELHCCNNPGRTTDTCRTSIMNSCMLFDQIAMNTITGFDADAAAAAFSELEAKASQCDTTVAVWGGSADGLRGILKGTLPSNADCKPKQNLTDQATTGAALASCTGITTTACLPQTLLGAWTCAPKNAAGGSCVTDDNCSAGLYCNNPSMALGTCAQPQAVGTACTTPSQCRSLYCKGSKCVTADQQAAYCLGD